VVAKVGAEGVYGAVVRDAGLGLALKVEDGARRAVEPALVGLLDALGVLSRDEAEGLEAFRRPRITNTRGEGVGRIEFVGTEPPGPNRAHAARGSAAAVGRPASSTAGAA